MTSKSRCLRRTCHSLFRTSTTLWLSTLLVASGVPATPRLEAHGGSATGLEQPDACGISASEAARFLEQATFGPVLTTDPSDPSYANSVAHVMEVCPEGWLQEQFSAPVRYPDNPDVPSVGTNYDYPFDPGSCNDAPEIGGGGGLCWSPGTRPAACTNNGDSTCQRDNYTAYLLQVQLFFNALTGVDQLRQRVAWALSEINVVSETDIVPASWMTPYIQLFDRAAFGNYRQLLYDLTLNPAMGEYLNMRGNTKVNVNENYAREVLQLFSIGLNELNDDGTPWTDENGNAIPTYGQEIIANFARVFTGWNLGAQLAPGVANYRDPMLVTNENNHDPSEVVLLNEQRVSGASSDELPVAIDNIFNHHNVGPFIGKQLIQKLVTSNPSNEYVQNVTNAFNSGSFTGPGGATFGSGTRGDLQATIAAILLDPEARAVPASSSYGHLREPVLFITNTLRALGNWTSDFVLADQFLPSGAGTNVRMDQDVWRAPTVFSYYPPDNDLPGSSLLAPEFAIHSTSTSLARINLIYDFAYHMMPVDTKNRPLGTWIDTTPYEPLAVIDDGTALVDDLNARLMHGNMSPALYDVVKSAVQSIPETDLTGRVQEAIYLIASSSQYQVQR